MPLQPSELAILWESVVLVYTLLCCFYTSVVLSAIEREALFPAHNSSCVAPAVTDLVPHRGFAFSIDVDHALVANI